MVIDPFSDGHIHTSYCLHASGTMEEYVKAAIRSGLHQIIFLEHLEEGIRSQRRTWLTASDFECYFEEGNLLKEKYAQVIQIGLGVEVGYNPACYELLLQRLKLHKWDRIGLSYHFMERAPGEDHVNLVSRREPSLLHLSLEEASIIEQNYYLSLMEALDHVPAGVLCHIDAVLRFYPRRQEMTPPWEVIDMFLDKVKMKGMAVEVNTSGLAIRNEIFPAEKILLRVLEKGIPLVAGSDAHRPEDVGYQFSTLEHYLETLYPAK